MTRINGTIELFPHHCKMPFKSSAENTTVAATQLAHVLNDLTPSSPLSSIGDRQMDALHQLTVIFQAANARADDVPKLVNIDRLEKEKVIHQGKTTLHNTPDPLPRVTTIDNSPIKSPHLLLTDDNESLRMISHSKIHHGEHHIVPLDDDISPEVPSYQYNLRPSRLRPKENKTIQYTNLVVHPSPGKVQEYRYLIKNIIRQYVKSIQQMNLDTSRKVLEDELKEQTLYFL